MKLCVQFHEPSNEVTNKFKKCASADVIIGHTFWQLIAAQRLFQRMSILKRLFEELHSKEPSTIAWLTNKILTQHELHEFFEWDYKHTATVYVSTAYIHCQKTLMSTWLHNLNPGPGPARNVIKTIAASYEYLSILILDRRIEVLQQINAKIAHNL